MALLTTTQRKKYFKYLGLGEYNKSNVLKFQKMAFTNTHEHDAVYGKKTDNALRHFHHVKLYAPSFKPEEFKCPCKKCTGYPTFMRAKELRHIQTIRDHYKKPMTITSGLRCKYENGRVGGSKTSGHLVGRAVDFYMKGVTDSLESRIKAVKYFSTLKSHEFSYGNGVAVSGHREPYTRIAPGMGNALHTETR